MMPLAPVGLLGVGKTGAVGTTSATALQSACRTPIVGLHVQVLGATRHYRRPSTPLLGLCSGRQPSSNLRIWGLQPAVCSETAVYALDAPRD